MDKIKNITNKPYSMFEEKLENFLNSRAIPKESPDIFFIEEEKNQFWLGVNTEKKSTTSLARWLDLLTKNTISKIIRENNYTKSDWYAISTYLSRLGYFFHFHKTQKSNKDYFLLFYFLQLLCTYGKKNEADKNHLLWWFHYELSLDEEIRDKLIIKRGRITFITEHSEELLLTDIISQIHTHTKSSPNTAALSLIENFQTSTIRLIEGSTRIKKRITLTIQIKILFIETFS